MKGKADKNFIHVHRLTPKECGNNTGTLDFKHLTISGEFNPNTHGVFTSKRQELVAQKAIRNFYIFQQFSGFVFRLEMSEQ